METDKNKTDPVGSNTVVSCEIEKHGKTGRGRRVCAVFTYIFGSLASALSLVRLICAATLIPSGFGSLGGALYVVFDILFFGLASAALYLIAALINLVSAHLFGKVWTVGALVYLLSVPLYWAFIANDGVGANAATVAFFSLSVALPNILTCIAVFDLSLARARRRQADVKEKE